jgi:hypothetical protein
VNAETLARWGLSRQKQTKTGDSRNFVADPPVSRHRVQQGSSSQQPNPQRSTSVLFGLFSHLWISLFSLNILIGWQLSTCNCHKPLFPSLYNCQLLCFCRLALSTAVQVFPLPFSPNIATSRMPTTNSLCLTVRPIHEWRLIFLNF